MKVEMASGYWCLAVVTGECPKCGRKMVREVKVHRDRRGWTKKDEPIPFGYMGDCPCGKHLGGTVRWPYLMVLDERPE